MGLHIGNRPGYNTIYGGASGGTGPANEGDPTTGSISYTGSMPNAGNSIGTANDMAVSPDGRHVLYGDFNGGEVITFSANTPLAYNLGGNITNAQKAETNILGTPIQFSAACEWSNNGKIMYTCGFQSNIIQIKVDDPWILTEANTINVRSYGRDSFPVPSTGAFDTNDAMLGFRFAENGRDFLIVANGVTDVDNRIYQFRLKDGEADFDLGTPTSNAANAGYEYIGRSTNTGGSLRQGVAFNLDGRVVYGCSAGNLTATDCVSIYDLSTPYDITTATHRGNFAVTGGSHSANGMDYVWDGTNHNLIFCGTNGNYTVWSWSPS